VAERVIDTLVTVFGFRTDRAQLDRARRNIESVRRGLDTFAQSVGIAGAAAGAALTAVGKTVLDFERAQNRVARVYLDQSRESLIPLREQARQLGATTSKSATEAANAQAILAQSGQEVNEVLATTPKVLSLAIAGELEMADAASLVTTQLNVFSLEASEASRVTDLLAAIATQSATDVRQLGPALRQVGGLAASAGLSLEQVGAAIGILRDAGRQPEQAGTALRNILLTLNELEPQPRVIEGLARLGLTFEDVQAALRVGGIAGLMRTLGEAGLELGTAAAIFDRETAEAAVALASRSGDLTLLEQRLYDVDGAAHSMQLRMEEGLPGATATFGSALQELMLSLGDAGVTGSMLRLLGYGTTLLRWLAELPGPIRTFAGWLVTATVALIATGLAARAVSFALAPLGLKMGILAAKTALVTAATWLFNTALFASPITWIILGIVALTAGLVVLALNFDKLQGAWVRSFNTGLNAMKEVWNWVQTHWPLLAATLGGPFTLIPYLMWRFRDTIETVLMGLWDWITGLFDGMFGWVDNLIDRVPFLRNNETRNTETVARGWATPSASAFSAAVSGVGINGARHVNANVQLDNINISVERGDPDEIASQVGRSLQQQLQDAAEDFGGRVIR